MKKHWIRVTLATAFAIATTGATSAFAVNWITSTGMEEPGAVPWRLFGFASVEYQHTGGSVLPAGNPFAGKPNALNQIGPEFEESSLIQIPYVRAGVRGSLFDGKLNYFFAPLAGYNGLTRLGGGAAIKITDASLTLNLIPNARIRLGQFKHPSGEEASQEPQYQVFVNPTDTTSQLLQERFFDSDGTPVNNANKDNGPASGIRDIGVQLFDAIRVGEWEHTYAVMLGQGNGILRGDNNSGKDLYLFWSSEWVFDGRGAKREGLKGYAFYQDGERTLRTGAAQIEGDFERTRWGIGATFKKGLWYAAGEYVKADGMIPAGSSAIAVPGTPSNNNKQVARYLMRPDDEANGYNFTVGYAIRPNWELFARYNRLNRATDTADFERRLETWSLSTRYYFSKDIYAVASYEWRDFRAPQLAASSVANTSLDTVDDRLGLRLYWIFF